MGGFTRKLMDQGKQTQQAYLAFVFHFSLALALVLTVDYDTHLVSNQLLSQ